MLFFDLCCFVLFHSIVFVSLCSFIDCLTCFEIMYTHTCLRVELGSQEMGLDRKHDKHR